MRTFEALRDFCRSQRGASLVEYAIALIVVAIAGGMVVTLTDNIGSVLRDSATAF